MKKFAGIFLSLFMLLFAAGCSGADMSNSAYLGTWKGTTAETSGLSLDVESILGGEFTLELKDNGKCVLNIAGDKETGDWKETDNGFMVEDEFTMIVNGDTGYMDYDGIKMNFER